MHNARNMSKIKTLGEHLLQVKGVNGTRLGDTKSRDEVLYNGIKVWNLALGS